MTIQECKKETMKHIITVKKIIDCVIKQLKRRAIRHDLSKLNPPEVEIFAEYTPKLAASTYGSDEYKQFLKEMKPALDHHYASNRHHPEHFINGIDDMNIIDVVEMLCDWKAATLRHNDGDLLKSIELNQKRFNISDQLKQILINTAPLLYKYNISWVWYINNHTNEPETICGSCFGDTIEQIHDKIDSYYGLSEIQKEYLKFGVAGEFKYEYISKSVELDDGTISWTVNW